MESRIKQILNAVVIIAVTLWLLKAFGVLNVLPRQFVSLTVILIVVGILLGLVNTYIPMASSIKMILNVIVIIAVILWLLSEFGIVGGLPRLHTQLPFDNAGRVHAYRNLNLL
jgi:hypothetical protein